MNPTPALIAAAITIAWLALSVPAGILIGRAIRTADLATGRCHCGTCQR